MTDSELFNIDELVKAGKIGKARRILNSLNLSKVPRSHIIQVSHLAYRVNLPNLSVRLLSPYIKETKPAEEPATDLEIAEYAIALSRLGASREAELWIEKVANKQNPTYLLYKSFIQISIWNYKSAIEYLNQYILDSTISEYQRLVAKTNLAAAYLFEEAWQPADEVLSELREVTERKKHRLLHANSLELSAQLEFGQGRYENSQNFINKGLKHLGDQESVAKFYLQKWQAFIECSQMENPIDIEARIAKIRKKALDWKVWETLRECDFHQAIMTSNEQLLLKVYFGSPHASYREKLVKHYNEQLSLPDHFDHQNNNLIIDTRSGQLLGGSETEFIKPGQLLNKLLWVLSTDLYRPFRLGTLFSFLFPEEYYDPNTSPDRIYQLIRRLKIAAKKKNLPINVLQREGGYQLNIEDSLGLRLYLKQNFEGSSHRALRLLQEEFGPQSFSLKEAQRKLKLSQTQTFKVITGDLKEQISRVGSGPKTKYRLIA